MKVVGMDVGGKNIHLVVMDDGQVLAKGRTASGIKKAEAAAELYDQVIRQAGLERKDIERVIATGSAGKRVSFAHGVISDAAADAKGVVRLIPSARTVIDVGAEEGRAIKVNPEGKVLDFAINEKCAAGTGTFVEAMARALEMPVEKMAEISLMSKEKISMNAQCAIFGESEVVSLIHSKIPRPDIARAVHDAIAGRIASVARIVGLEKDIVMIGGLSKNAGFLDALRRELGLEVLVPDDPDFVGALGAAVAAVTGVVEEEVKAKVVEKETFEKGKV
ncbi:MAG: acyl-CoA dehydratase activase [Thermodesulfobacteriota bacterium]